MKTMAAVPVLFGSPVTVLTGFLTLALLLTTTAVGLFKIQFKYHRYIGITTVLSALLHALTVIYSYYL
ncbi:hypothetical protein HZC09_05190 [Candidatus Micrarchaeota archaeon]|nr:hypothetical protein [Candidatus Micrarchaeota archaeon]